MPCTENIKWIHGTNTWAAEGTEAEEREEVVAMEAVGSEEEGYT